MTRHDYAPSGNEGKSMEPTGAPRPGFPSFYPDRLNNSNRERLTCGRCNGQGHMRHGHDCAWCSARGWNYAA